MLKIEIFSYTFAFQIDIWLRIKLAKHKIGFFWVFEQKC